MAANIKKIFTLYSVTVQVCGCVHTCIGYVVLQGDQTVNFCHRLLLFPWSLFFPEQSVDSEGAPLEEWQAIANENHLNGMVKHTDFKSVLVGWNRHF